MGEKLDATTVLEGSVRRRPVADGLAGKFMVSDADAGSWWCGRGLRPLDGLEEMLRGLVCGPDR